VVAIAIATTSDDAERRASAAVAAAVIGLVLVVVAVAAARARGGSAGPTLLALADRNGLALIPWRRRDVAPTGTLLVHASHHDVDVLQDADQIAWGRSTLLVGGGRRSRSGMHGEQLAFLEVPLRAAVPHL
ncbi:hypothetical protein, partial [Burkholderia cenocepacia]|uniref:hypothetical protein n=1 Tax=Burkholderia cenocepacia TaxID=95486 RepID=UPI0038CC1C59